MGVSPGKFHWNSPGQFAVRPSTDSVHHRFSVTHLPTKKTWQGRSVTLPETIIENSCASTWKAQRKAMGFLSQPWSTMVLLCGKISLVSLRMGDSGGDRLFLWCPVTQYVYWNMSTINYQILCGHKYIYNYIYIICHEHIYIIICHGYTVYIYNICHEA